MFYRCGHKSIAWHALDVQFTLIFTINSVKRDLAKQIDWQWVSRNCLDHELASRISRGSARTLFTLPRESRRCWNYARYKRCAAMRIQDTRIVHWRMRVGKCVLFHRCRDLDARLMRIITRRDIEATVIQLTMGAC